MQTTTDTACQEMSFDLFTQSSVISQQEYCWEREYPKTGSKKDLAAMAYSASRTNASLQMSQVDSTELGQVELKDFPLA